MKLLSIFFFSTIFLSSLAQSQLEGLVVLQNSGNKSAFPAQVSCYGASDTDVDSERGYFRLVFDRKKPGSAVYVEIEKPGYEVVNKEDLNAVLLSAGEVANFKIHLCPEGQWQRFADDYYQINLSEILDSHKQRLARLNRKYKSADAAYREEFKALEEERDIAIVEAERLAEEFAKANLDDKTDRYRKAFALFAQAKLDSVLLILPQAEIEEDIAKAKRVRKEAQQTIIRANNNLQQHIEELMILARTNIIKGKRESALQAFAKAIDTDSTNYANVFEYGEFLKDIKAYDEAIYWLSRVIQDDNEIWRRGNAHKYIGELQQETGRFSEAMKAYRSFEVTYRRLLKEQPENSFCESNLAISYSKLGALYQAQGKTDTAMFYFLAQVKLFEELCARNTESKVLKSSLATSYGELGNSYNQMDSTDRAIKYTKKAASIFENLVEQNPNSKVNKNNLSTSYFGLSMLYQSRGQLDTALIYLLSGTDLSEELYLDNHKSEELKKGLAVSYVGL
ncbi:MAG: hypothetical protein AAF738_07670, partial [Bacteroidota bacterium]